MAPMTRNEFYWCLRGLLCGFIDLFRNLGQRRRIMENELRQQRKAVTRPLSLSLCIHFTLEDDAPGGQRRAKWEGGAVRR